jgi:PAS domain S-box-containing protein
MTIFGVPKLGLLARYVGVPVLAVALSTALRLALDPLIGGDSPYIVFIMAVVLAAWLGGFGPGLVSIVFGALSSTFLIVRPPFVLALPTLESQVHLAVYLTIGLFLDVVIESIRRARHRAEVAERELRASEEWLRVTLRSIADGVIATDETGRVALMNVVAEKLTGWKSAEAFGKPLGEVFRVVNEQTREPIEDPVSAVLRNRAVVELSNDTVLLARDGGEYPIADLGAPILDDAEKIRGVVLVFQDQTEQITAEKALRRLNAELEQRVAERTKALSDLNADLEAFTYTVAHDLRSPVRNMHSLADALVEDFAAELPDEARDYTQRIVGAAIRMDTLIRDLLAYARLTREAIRLQPLDLDDVLTDVLRQMRQELQERGAEVSAIKPLGSVVAHRTTLGQVMTNLLGNAVKFVERGKFPRVTVCSEDTGDRVRLWVEDNGIGIDPAHRDRIFRVFDRLHAQEAYPGTGIGLAIVRRGAERMGGACGVEPADGGGSRFWLELKKVEKKNVT